MQVVFPTELDEQSMSFDASADMKRIGGPIALEAGRQQQVTVQVYVDHSAVEVFLSSGEALSTRQLLLPLMYSPCVPLPMQLHCRNRDSLIVLV